MDCSPCSFSAGTYESHETLDVGYRHGSSTPSSSRRSPLGSSSAEADRLAGSRRGSSAYNCLSLVHRSALQTAANVQSQALPKALQQKTRHHFSWKIYPVKNSNRNLSTEIVQTSQKISFQTHLSTR